MKSSTERAGRVAVAAGISLLTWACARTQVVEAPMIAADGGASTFVASGDAARPEIRVGDAQFVRGERFTGFYYCAQGRTALSLVIDEVLGDDVAAIFEFSFPGRAGFPAADGSYRVRGSYQPGSRTLRLDAESWIDQPPDYQMVNLLGKVSASRTITGTLQGAPGCTTFSVSPARHGAEGSDGSPRPRP